MGHFVNYLSRIMSKLFMECVQEDFVDLVLLELMDSINNLLSSFDNI